MEKEMNRLYREIVETVNEMIPEDWNKFYFYAQISENGGGTYFYYNTLENMKFKYSLEIPFQFQIDADEFERKEDILYTLSKELRSTFKENGQNPWYAFTKSLESNGKFNMHYDYTNWFNTDYSFSDQMIIWTNKYLGEVPNDDKDKALIEKYNREFSTNPI